MGARKHPWKKLSGGAIALVALVAATAGFRCPGAEPAATSGGPGGGGGGGAGGTGGAPGTTTSQSASQTSTDASTSVSTDASTSTTVDVSSSSGTGGSSSSGGCTADLMNDPTNCGECGRICALTQVNIAGCMNGVCSPTCMPGFFDLSSPLAPDPDDGCESYERRVFVTSTPHFPNFLGAVGGDSICQSIGDSVFGFGPTWAAWLSDGTTSPSLRFNRSLAAYKLVDGTVVALDWSDLTDGSLTHPIDLDEHGLLWDNAEVWTATDEFGDLAGADCSEWTMLGTGMMGSEIAGVGNTAGVLAEWTAVYDQFCNRDNVRLYCFEQ